MCTQQLDVHDIHETTAGVKGADITDHFFQLALSSPSLLQAGEQVCGGLAALQKLVTFLTTQQLTKTKCNEDMRAVYESNLQAKEQELLDTKQSCTEQLQEMEQTIGRLQAELADKSREEAQLQDSLKEKIRKCQAWEKVRVPPLLAAVWADADGLAMQAYTNIRQQLINHPPLAPPQPPKPPPPVQPQWASPLPQQHWPQQQAPQWPQPPPQPQLQRAHQQTYWQQTPQQTSYTSRTVATVATPEPLPAFLRQDPYKQQQPAPVYPPPRTTGYYQETRRPSLPPPSRPSYPHPQLR